MRLGVWKISSFKVPLLSLETFVYHAISDPLLDPRCSEWVVARW